MPQVSGEHYLPHTNQDENIFKKTSTIAMNSAQYGSKTSPKSIGDRKLVDKKTSPAGM